MRFDRCLMVLAFYLPFEPFLLKWVPESLYVFARFAPEVLIYGLCILVFVQVVRSKAVWKRTPADTPFVFFLLILFFSVLINAVPVFQALLGIRQILRFVLLFFLTVQLSPSRNWTRVLLFGLAVIVAIQLLIGTAQSLSQGALDPFLLPAERHTLGEITLTAGTNQFWDPGQRIFGTMGRYDQLGTFLAFFMIIGLAFVYEKESIPKKYRLFIASVLMFSIPVLAFTYSRSAWFGFFIGLLFVSVYMRRDRRVLIGAIAVFSLLGIYLIASHSDVKGLADAPDQTLAHRFLESFSARRFQGEYYGLGRVYWLTQTVEIVVPSAPFFGVGPGRYGGGAVSALGDKTVYEALGLPFGVYGSDGYIDNNWLSLWGETGTLGLIAYLTMYVSIFLACVRVARSSADPETRALALGVAGAMLAVMVNASLATALEFRTLAPYMWILAGIVIARDSSKN
ncbi:MAG: O-antigen ligase family protein [Patescibacteria group bacterium]